MRKCAIILIVFLSVLQAYGQRIESCDISHSGGFSIRTVDVPYVATASVDGEGLTSTHRFSIFYTDAGSVSGSILTFKIIHKEDWAIPEGSEIVINFDDGGRSVACNCGSGKSEQVGLFFASDFSIMPDDGRLIYMDKAVSMELVTSSGACLIISPGESWQRTFDDVYFEVCDVLKKEGWSKKIL